MHYHELINIPAQTGVEWSEVIDMAKDKCTWKQTVLGEHRYIIGCLKLKTIDFNCQTFKYCPHCGKIIEIEVQHEKR